MVTFAIDGQGPNHACTSRIIMFSIFGRYEISGRLIRHFDLVALVLKYECFRTALAPARREVMAVGRLHTMVVLVGNDCTPAVLCLVQISLHVGVQVLSMVHIGNIIYVCFRVWWLLLSFLGQNSLSFRALVFNCASRSLLLSGDVGRG